MDPDYSMLLLSNFHKGLGVEPVIFKMHHLHTEKFLTPDSSSPETIFYGISLLNAVAKVPVCPDFMHVLIHVSSSLS